MLDTILFRQGKRIIKDSRGILEPDAMLAEIAFRFPVVPLKVSFYTTLYHNTVCTQ